MNRRGQPQPPPLWSVDRGRGILIYCDPEGKMLLWPFKLAEACGFNTSALALSGVGLPDFPLR